MGFGAKAVQPTDDNESAIVVDAKRRKTEPAAYVYVIQMLDRKRQRTKYVKIGRTKRSPHKRLQDLQTGCPFELRLRAYMVVTLSESKTFEKFIHDHFFGGQYVRGEWYELTEDDIQYLIQWLEQFKNK